MKGRTPYYIAISLLIAIIGMFGSLFYGEVLGIPPCILCWYQRICLYPLVPIFAIGLWLNDKRCAWYALPLVFVGWVIGLYHNLLVYGFVNESLAPCTAGVSCVTQAVRYFGFVTIPLMSLVALTIILLCLILFIREHRLERLKVTESSSK